MTSIFRRFVDSVMLQAEQPKPEERLVEVIDQSRIAAAQQAVGTRWLLHPDNKVGRITPRTPTLRSRIL